VRNKCWRMDDETACPYDEGLYVNPLVPEEEPYRARNPKTGGDTASGYCEVGGRSDFEDRINRGRKNGDIDAADRKLKPLSGRQNKWNHERLTQQTP